MRTDRCVCMCVYVFMYVRIHVYMYIHTHTHRSKAYVDGICILCHIIMHTMSHHTYTLPGKSCNLTNHYYSSWCSLPSCRGTGCGGVEAPRCWRRWRAWPSRRAQSPRVRCCRPSSVGRSARTASCSRSSSRWARASAAPGHAARARRPRRVCADCRLCRCALPVRQGVRDEAFEVTSDGRFRFEGSGSYRDRRDRLDRYAVDLQVPPHCGCPACRALISSPAARRGECPENAMRTAGARAGRELGLQRAPVAAVLADGTRVCGQTVRERAAAEGTERL
jgi:hypothetical protein